MLLLAAALDPIGRAYRAARQSCRMVGGRFTAARVRGRGRGSGLERSRRANWKHGLLFAGSQGGTAAREGGNNCNPLSGHYGMEALNCLE
jgi:hypothetical protein